MTEDQARALRRRSHAEASAALHSARRARAQGRPDLVALALTDLTQARADLRTARAAIARLDDEPEPFPAPRPEGETMTHANVVALRPATAITAIDAASFICSREPRDLDLYARLMTDAGPDLLPDMLDELERARRRLAAGAELIAVAQARLLSSLARNVAGGAVA